MKENLNDKLSDALNNVDDGYIEKTADPPKKKRNLWIRVGAIAACLALVAAAISTWVYLDSARLSADYISEFFPRINGPTNTYTEVFVPDPEYLYIKEIPESRYLPVYERTGFTIDSDDFQCFADYHMPKMIETLGIEDYEVKEFNFDTSIDFFVQTENYYVSVAQREECRYVSLNSGLEHVEPPRELILNGKTITVDQRLSDEEILLSLTDIRDDLFELFGRDFPDAKVFRHYDDVFGEYCVQRLYVYYYDESAHGLNGITRDPYSDYIVLDFDNYDTRSEDYLYRVFVSYRDYPDNRSDGYKKASYHKRIPLEEAEEMLAAGHVFAHHSCRLCMAQQDAVDFADYDYVGLEYLFDREYTEHASRLKGITGVPFYAFYKQIGRLDNGFLVYAKAYVPAVKVSGLEAYFAAQERDHPKAAPQEDYPAAPKDDEDE